MTRSFALALPFALAATGLWAEPATPDGAKALTAVLQTYLGDTPGLVAVAVQGDAYAVTLDASPLIALIPADANLKLTLSPLEMTVSDTGNGLWSVAVDQPLRLDATIPGTYEAHGTIARLTTTATFSTDLGDFASSSTRIEGLVFDQTVTDGGADQTVHYELPESDYTSTSVAGANGGVDVTAHAVIPTLAEVMAVPFDPATPPIDVTLTAAENLQDITITGYRAKEVLALIAWAQAHKADTTLDAASLKPALTAALPLFETMSTTGTGGTLTALTPMGDFGASALTFALDLHGLTSDGLFREAFALQGLTLPAGLLPDWSAPLLPTDTSLDFSVTGYDAAAAAPLAIDMLDLLPDGTPTQEAQDQLVAKLLPTGEVTMTLAPGATGNADWRLTYEGSLTAGPDTDIPTGTARLTLSGIDTIVAALNAAPDDIKSTTTPALLFLRGMSKAGPDGTLVWELDGSTAGQFLVNGNDVMQAFQ